MPKFERMDYDPAVWGKIFQDCPDRVVFQSPAWLQFLAETQKGEIVLAALREGNATLGYFTGLIVRKFGIKILGSPFRLWSTPYMGFNMCPGVPRKLAFAALSEFAFKTLGCVHFEVSDAYGTMADVEGLDLPVTPQASLEIDLRRSEEELLMGMTKTCRWTVRKGEKNGVVIQPASDPQFAEEYYEQLKDVFAKQGSVPHIPPDRTAALVRNLLPTGDALLLRALAPEGPCAGTAVIVCCHEMAFYWGGASFRQYQKIYPNELLQWAALRACKARGIKTYNMVGTMEFKQKFGGRETVVPMVARSKYWLLAQARTRAPQLARRALKVVWKLKNLGRKPPAPAAETPATPPSAE